MNLNHPRFLLFVATLLWLVLGCTLVAAAVAPEIQTVTQVADIARQKDIVWLSLVTAIAAIGFSAWLVRQMVNQQTQVVKSLQELRAELASRPCVYLPNETTPPKHHP